MGTTRTIRSLMVAGTLAATTGWGQAPDTLRLSLEETVARALTHSAALRVNDLAVETSEVVASRAARARWAPSLDLRTISGVVPRRRASEPVPGVYASPDSTTTLGDLRPFVDVRASLVQPLLTFGKISSAIEAARAGVRAAEAARGRTEADLAADMTRLYWAMVLARELDALVNDARSKMASAEKTIREKLDADDESVTYEDLWKVQLFAFDVNKNYEKLFKEQRMAQATTRLTLGLGPSTLMMPTEEGLRPVEFTTPNLDAALAAAREQRPELRQLSAVEEAAAAKIGVAKAQFKPTIFLAGEYHYNWAMGMFDPRNPFQYNPFNFSRPAGVVGMSVNLNQHLLMTELQEARLARQQVAEQKRRATEGITLEVQQAYYDFEEARANVAHSEEARRAGERWQRAAAQNWDLGIGETKDLIDAYKANGAMQAAYFEAVFDYNVAVTRLQRTAGIKFWTGQ